MTDLAEFLLARITEDEAAARADALQHHVRAATYVNGTYPAGRFGPPHILAECEAKRRLIEDESLRMSTLCQEGCYWTVLAYLALPYADHPDYEEWRP